MSQPSWIGHTLNGLYQVEALMGHGGMSAVYRATDTKLRRTVAVKIIHAHLANNQKFVRRFEKEAAAIAQLNHTNIVKVYDFNIDNGSYYMVLEFIPGDTLDAWLKRLSAAGRRLAIGDALKITSQISDAVSYAHEHGLIHRDLKPANIIITPNGRPVLMDFGIAKIVGLQTQTATGALLGTVPYMSPEQIRGEKSDHRADVYALGVMLFEMLIGKRPFVGESAPATMMMHLTNPVPKLAPTNPDIPDSLDHVIAKAMAKTPSQRYQSAKEIGNAIRAISAQYKPAVQKNQQSFHPSGQPQESTGSYTGSQAAPRPAISPRPQPQAYLPSGPSQIEEPDKSVRGRLARFSNSLFLQRLTIGCGVLGLIAFIVAIVGIIILLSPLN